MVNMKKKYIFLDIGVCFLVENPDRSLLGFVQRVMGGSRKSDFCVMYAMFPDLEGRR